VNRGVGREKKQFGANNRAAEKSPAKFDVISQGAKTNWNSTFTFA
jgi:hypothetical protein